MPSRYNEVLTDFRAFYEWKPYNSEPITVSIWRTSLSLWRGTHILHRTLLQAQSPAARGAETRIDVCQVWGRDMGEPERPVHLAIRKANKLGDLGCDSWRELPNSRPRHMRLAKFELLKARQRRLVAQINTHIAGQIMRKGFLL